MFQCLYQASILRRCYGRINEDLDVRVNNVIDTSSDVVRNKEKLVKQAQTKKNILQVQTTKSYHVHSNCLGTSLYLYMRRLFSIDITLAHNCTNLAIFHCTVVGAIQGELKTHTRWSDQR